MIKHGYLKKYSEETFIIFYKIINSLKILSHEINQFCSKHSLQDVYINQFDTLDESLVIVLINNLYLKKIIRHYKMIAIPGLRELKVFIDLMI